VHAVVHAKTLARLVNGDLLAHSGGWAAGI